MEDLKGWVWVTILLIITVGIDLFDAWQGHFDLFSWKFAIHVIASAGAITYQIWRSRKSKSK